MGDVPGDAEDAGDADPASPASSPLKEDKEAGQKNKVSFLP